MADGRETPPPEWLDSYVEMLGTQIFLTALMRFFDRGVRTGVRAATGLAVEFVLDGDGELAAPPPQRPVGVPPEMLASLQVTPGSPSAPLTTAECSVCWEALGDASVVCLPCEHVFHLEPCMKQWLETHTTCPLCRASVIDPRTRPARSASAAPAVRVSAIARSQSSAPSAPVGPAASAASSSGAAAPTQQPLLRARSVPPTRLALLAAASDAVAAVAAAPGGARASEALGAATAATPRSVGVHSPAATAASGAPVPPAPGQRSTAISQSGDSAATPPPAAARSGSTLSSLSLHRGRASSRTHGRTPTAAAAALTARMTALGRAHASVSSAASGASLSSLLPPPPAAAATSVAAHAGVAAPGSGRLGVVSRATELPAATASSSGLAPSPGSARVSSTAREPPRTAARASAARGRSASRLRRRPAQPAPAATSTAAPRNTASRPTGRLA